MRTALAVVAMLAVMNLAAAEQVVVYVDGCNAVDLTTLRVAEYVAGMMFARIGVSVKWHGGTPPHGDTAAMVVHLVSGVPSEDHPGALGYTTLVPHSAARVFVMADRAAKAADTHLAPVLLAHVFVHEMTHALEGINRHAETGVMKAHWTSKDHLAMTRKPLEFTPADVNIIHYRLAHR